MALRAGVRVKQRPETIFRRKNALKDFLALLELRQLLRCQLCQWFSQPWFFVCFAATQEHAQDNRSYSFRFHFPHLGLARQAGPMLERSVPVRNRQGSKLLIGC